MALTTAKGSVWNSAENNLAVNVKDAPFNAKGDGVTDDTAAIQAAIDSGVGKVYIPEGEYLISTLSINRNYFTLCGDGKFSSTLKTNSSSSIALKLASTQSVTGINLSNFAIFGNSSNLGGISFGDSSNVAVANIESIRIVGFSDTNAYGVSLNLVQNIEFKDCWIDLNYYNVYRPNSGYCTTTEFKGYSGHIGLSLSKGVYVLGQCEDLVFSNVTFEGSEEEAIYIEDTAVAVTKGSRIVVDNCYFEDNIKNGTADSVIKVIGNLTQYQQHNLTVKACNFNDNPNAAATWYNISVDRSISYIANNFIKPSRILTTANCYTRCEVNRFPAGESYAATYKNLLGSVSVSDFDAPFDATSLNQINLQNSLTFPATPRSVDDVNTLDDYSENTWTPSATGFGGTVTTTEGSYTKIGNQVFFQVRVLGTAITSTYTTSKLTLPFALPSGILPSVCSVFDANSGDDLGLGYITNSSGNGVIFPPTWTTDASSIILTGHYTAE